MKPTRILIVIGLIYSTTAVSLVSDCKEKITVDFDNEKIEALTLTESLDLIAQDFDSGIDWVYIHEPLKLLSISKTDSYGFLFGYSFSPWHTVYRRSRGPPSVEKVTIK